MVSTTVLINIDIPYIAWPVAPDINYHQDLKSSILYGGKVIVLDTDSGEYVELDGYFDWVETVKDIDGNTISESNIGTYSQDVKFVENESATNTPADISYRAALNATTHEVEFIIKATSVQFNISDNDVKYDGTAQEATIKAVASSGLDLAEGTDYFISYYQFGGNNVINYFDEPTEIGTYFIAAEFYTNNYHHEGTLDYTGKQIGVLNIYESEPTTTYSISFDGYSEFDKTDVYEQTIHILPTIVDKNGDTSTAYTGWSYNGSVYSFGARFGQPASDVVLTPVEAPDSYNLSGYVYGQDLNGDKDVALNKIGVAIMQGSEMIANTETDSDGYYSFDLPSGYYMVVITRDQFIYNEITVYVNLQNEAIILDDVLLPDTVQNTVVEIASNVYVNSADGLDSLLNYYLQEDGTKLVNKILLTIDPVSTTGTQITDFEAIRDEALKSNITTDSLKLFFDINVFREYNGNTTDIEELPEGEYLEFYIPLTGDYQNKNNYIVYRYHTHDGVAGVDTITTTENQYGEKLEILDSGQTLKIKAKYYSVYAVAFIETTATSTTPSTTTTTTTTASTSTNSTSTATSTSTSTTYYTVTYELNGGKGSLPSVESYQSGTVVTVKSNTVLQDGYIFTGWLDSATGKVYLANESFTMPSENVVLTAQWSHIYNPVNIPETGDISNTPLLIFLIGIFGIGMIFTRKKQERKV